MVGSAVEIARALRRAGTDSAGELHSRVDYTPYGVAMHSYAADLNGNGTIDGTDVGLFLTNLNSGSPLKPDNASWKPDGSQITPNRPPRPSKRSFRSDQADSKALKPSQFGREELPSDRSGD